MKKVIPKKGFLNRKKFPLPTKECTIEIIQTDFEGDELFLCKWMPHDPKETIHFPTHSQPGKGYLGSAVVISKKHKGIGFNVWEQNDQEFLYYKLIDTALYSAAYYSTKIEEE